MKVKITLQHLEAFVQVAHRQNFRAAAEILHVSQPALSRTVRLAEEALNARLFDRDTRHVSLTAEGRELLPIANRILREFDDSFSDLAQFSAGRRGQVVLATLPSIGVSLVPHTIAAFRAIHPEVTYSIIELAQKPLMKAVEEGVVDFGICGEPLPDNLFRYTHLINDSFVMVCRKDHPLALHESVSWSVFASHPYISSSELSSIRPITDAAMLQGNVRVTPAFNYSSAASAGAMVAAGLGITALPQLTLALINTTDLAVVPLVNPTMSRSIGIVSRANRSLSPATRNFMGALTSCAASQGG